MTPRPDFADALDAVLRREIAGCVGLRGIERLSGGASMETYRLTLETTAGAAGGGTTRSLCLRRGAGGVDRESDYVSGLGVEALAMTAARRAGVAEPEVLYVLAPDDGVGVGFLMEWLDGVTLGARVVRSPELDDVRPQLAYQCGRQLARIHAVDLDSTGLRDVLRHITPADYLEQTWARCRAYPTPQPMIDFTARWLGDNVVSEFEPALVHNDFRNGNLMIDPQRGITAVLDWETVHIGDPMRDLGWVCTNSWRFGRRDLPVGGFGTYDDLFAGYEDESGIRVDPARVRYWEVFGSFWWAVSCLTMAEHYRTGPDPTVERPAIGRRCSECQIDCVNLLIPGEVDLVEGAAEGAVGAAGGEAAGAAGGEMPTLDELLTSVRDFLHGDVMDATTARTNYLARVAANSLDIVRREL
ncbi:MAG TPA: phosphotransferase family protein, partial [Acidimicrobiaceae bacterium]|nr:phosphotransferase family protein [Acidimicrobiaceae bacterium]